MTQLLSTSLVIPLVSITPGAAGKENSKWEGRREMRDGRGEGGGRVGGEGGKGERKGKRRGGERIKEGGEEVRD